MNRYVRKLKETRKAYEDAYLDLDWAPGEAQADFGEADFYLLGTRRRMHYFVVTFPYSNVGFAQVLSENSECVCEGLKKIFEYTGGVPSRIVFDNATGIGTQRSAHHRRVRAHYGFAYSFLQPRLWKREGKRENKVGFIRRNLFTPPAQVHNIDIFNKHLLDAKALGQAAREPESQLFVEDSFALSGLPQSRLTLCATYLPGRTSKERYGGHHYYSSRALQESWRCGRSACRYIPATARSLNSNAGDAPTDTTSPASQLPLLGAQSQADGKLQGQKRDA